MDIASTLPIGDQATAGTTDSRRQTHQYPTRNTAHPHDHQPFMRLDVDNAQRPVRGSVGSSAGSAYGRGSPVKKDQKHVVFQLIDPEDPRIQARLPMRVMISRNDPIDRIVTTVKNFYGLYEYGVSFETKDGTTIVAAYDSFENDMTVYVRAIAPPPSALVELARDSASPKKPSLGAPFEMRPPTTHSQPPYRPVARSAGARSLSPQSELGRRSASVAPGGKPRSLRTKSKDNSVLGDTDGYSSGDNGEGSVASSRRSKTEQVNAEISVDNIVEGGRRKRAFESSELPLFVPPQVPMTASISSISPQRRSGPPNVASPYAYPNQQTFAYNQPLPSPQSHGSGPNHTQSGVVNVFSGIYPHPSRQLRGGRPSVSTSSARHANSNILPTPDPTVGSVISDEDVALQLMRLGDPTAFSHGRTSTSTVDDALSGKAEAASSDEEDDEDEDDDGVESPQLPAVPRFPKDDAGPQRKRQRIANELPSDGTSGEEYEDQHDNTFKDGDGMHPEHTGPVRTGKSKHSKHSGHPRAPPTAKPKAKSAGISKPPMSPASNPTLSRKGSIASTINFQHQLGADEEDLSSKPRCQRCRKSKKGCDRQRPCGRCKDAGIGVDGCLSEDEGNGRKGRYGRHMGVPVKKADEPFGGAEGAPPPPLPPATAPQANHYFLAPALPDKNKKRKR